MIWIFLYQYLAHSIAHSMECAIECAILVYPWKKMPAQPQ